MSFTPHKQEFIMVSKGWKFKFEEELVERWQKPFDIKAFKKV